MACDLTRECALRARGFFSVAGLDEAGRGPLAGPVVAAAVILPENYSLTALDDSKKLSAGRREKLFALLATDTRVIWATGTADVAEIDRLNILRATHLAMARALEALPLKPQHALVDGLPVGGLPVSHTALVGGDALSLSIAAASIIAKVTRDRMMKDLDEQFPEYGFARHKGYGVRKHLEALQRHGPCPIHRRSFAPVALAEKNGQAAG
jgi:ribonuclease HII